MMTMSANAGPARKSGNPSRSPMELRSRIQRWGATPKMDRKRLAGAVLPASNMTRKDDGCGDEGRDVGDEIDHTEEGAEADRLEEQISQDEADGELDRDGAGGGT